MLGPVLQLIGVLVGIGALGVLAFNLPLLGRPAAELPDTRSEASGNDHRVSHPLAGAVGALLFVVAPLAVAARGAYLGVLPSFVRPRGPEVTFAQTPGLFALNLLAYVLWASVFAWLMLRTRGAGRGAEPDRRVTSRAARNRADH